MSKKSVILTILCAIFVLCLFTACSSKNIEVDEVKYDWTYSPTMSDKCDDNVIIDGVLNDEIWNGKKQLVHSVDEMTMKITTAFTQKGLYIGATVEDPYIKWTSRMNNLGNSCFWFSVKNSDVTYEVATKVFNIYVDGKNAWNMNGIKCVAKGKTNKDYDSNPNSLSVEVFVSWDSLNIKLGPNGEFPEYIRINPHYRRTDATGTANWVTPLFYFDERDRQITSGRFDKDGYINADKQGAVLGNSYNGYSKSDGWNLSQINNGIIKSEIGHSQGIFFKNIYSKQYYYTVTVEMTDKSGNPDVTTPNGAGVMDANNQIENNMFYLSALNTLEKKQTQCWFLSNYNEGAYGWKTSSLSIKPKYNSNNTKITYTVIKDGGYFYYIVNGEFVSCKYISHLQEESCPGLFAIDSQATFTDYSAVDLQDSNSLSVGRLCNKYGITLGENDDIIDALLNVFGTYRVKTPLKVVGGSVELSSGAVSKNGEVAITVNPAVGYLLTGFTINDEDCYEEVISDMENGVYLLKNITQTMTVTPKFTRIPSGNTVKITGKLTIEGTRDPVLKARLTLKGNDKVLYYTVDAQNNGTYNFVIPKKGSCNIDGKTFDFDGEYKIIIKANGYVPIADEVVVNDTNLTNNYEMATPRYDVSSYGMVEQEDGTFAYVGDSSGNAKRGYVFNSVDTVSETIYYSVKINVSSVPESFGNVPVIGFAITDKTELSKFEDTYKAINLGINKLGVSSWCTVDDSLISMYRRLDVDASDRWNNTTTNINTSFNDEYLERTLTVILWKDSLYIFVDGVLVRTVSITDETYFNTKFASNGKYTIGLCALQVNPNITDIVYEIIDEKYGENASNYITSSGIFNNLLNKKGILEVEDGLFKVTDCGSGNRAYKYTNENTASKTAVYSVEINTAKVPTVSGNIPNIGIVISNKRVSLSDATLYKAIQIGLGNLGLTSWCTSDDAVAAMYRRLDLGDDRFNNTTVNSAIALTNENLTRTLTVILFENNIYAYVDNVLIKRIAINDGNYFNTEFNSNDDFIFGINALNFDTSSNDVYIKVKVEKYGEDAISEIKNNYSDTVEIIGEGSGFTLSNGTYSTGNIKWNETAYAYNTPNKYSNTCVYSVKISVAMKNGAVILDRPDDEKSMWQNIGIVMESDATSNNNLLRLGLSDFGVVSWVNQKNVARRIDNGNKFDFTSVNENTALISNHFERILTVVLYEDCVYVYVDNEYIKKLNLTENDNYFGNPSNFNANSNYKFGLSVSSIHSGYNTVNMQILTEKYGEDAISEITSKYTQVEINE